MSQTLKMGHACTISHIADRYRHYPGEDVILYTRVEVLEDMPGFALRVTIPEGLQAGDTMAPEYAVPMLQIEPDEHHLIWRVTGPVRAGERYDYQITAQIAPTQEDRVLKSSATLTVPHDAGVRLAPEETLSIHVMAKGRYLKYLPALYHRDELMGRFLMLFESFWAPIEGQITQMPLYFDPQMTPSDLLPWLASWLSLVLDESCPENRQRELIRRAASLYRRRGTRAGIAQYLEAYTGHDVEIIEHRANNFVLGIEGQLGPGIALGMRNQPHTFTVIVHAEGEWTDIELKDRQQASKRIAGIKAIIDAEKPAHTGYTLRIEPSPKGDHS